MFFRKNSELKPIKLNDIIEKKSQSDYGFFNDIAIDLSKFSNDEQTPDNIFIPVYYALRLAAAGMYAQGIITGENVDIVKTIFMNRSRVINLRASEEEARNFQNESYQEAMNWINENYMEIDGTTASLLIKAAEDGKSPSKGTNFRNW